MEILIIILSILRILGLILLGILFVAVLLIIFVLFIPIRYGIYSEKKENNEFIAKVNVSWFLKFLNCHYCYENEASKFAVKILGFTIISDQKKVKVEHDIKERDKESNQAEQIKSEQTQSEQAKPEQEENYRQEIDKEESISFKEKINNAKAKIDLVIEKIKYIYNYQQRAEIQSLTINYIKKIISTLKPKVFKINGEIGFESPDITGYFTIGASVLEFINLDINLKENFEKQIVAGEVIIKGKFRVWSVLWPTIKYILKKPIRNLIKQLI